jgi:hypothetical protein
MGIGSGNSTIPDVTTSTSTIIRSSPTGTGSGTNTGSGNATSSTVPVKSAAGKTESGVFIAGLGAFVAAIVLL